MHKRAEWQVSGFSLKDISVTSRHGWGLKPMLDSCARIFRGVLELNGVFRVKQLSVDELYDKLKGKPFVEWTDLVRIIHDEFQVTLVVGENPPDEELADVVNDPDVVRQIQMSRLDRENGRIYTRETGLQYFRTKTKRVERE